MKEYAGRMCKVNLDGASGCAEVDVRVLMPVTEARAESRHMLASGYPLRVLMPEDALDRPGPAPAEARGLYEKYKIERTDGSSGYGKKHEHCEYFVLDLSHDEHAGSALLAYADSCEAQCPELAGDLRNADCAAVTKMRREKATPGSGPATIAASVPK